MTTSHSDTLDWVVFGLAILMICEGLLTAMTGRGLVDRAIPGQHLTSRLVRGAIWLLLAGLLFYAWRG